MRRRVGRLKGWKAERGEAKLAFLFILRTCTPSPTASLPSLPPVTAHSFAFVEIA